MHIYIYIYPFFDSEAAGNDGSKSKIRFKWKGIPARDVLVNIQRKFYGQTNVYQLSSLSHNKVINLILVDNMSLVCYEANLENFAATIDHILTILDHELH